MQRLSMIPAKVGRPVTSLEAVQGFVQKDPA